MSAFYFSSRSVNLTVVLKPSFRQMVGMEIVTTPGIKARFLNGIFTTDDPAVAEMLRKVGDPTICEITEADLTDVQRAHNRPRNTRGVATSEALKIGDPTKPAIAEKPAATGYACEICGKEFKSRQGLNVHMVGHRPAVKDISEQAPAAAPAEPSAVVVPATNAGAPASNAGVSADNAKE